MSANNGETRLRTEHLNARYGTLVAVKDVTIGFERNRVHALIGPSGCGKSTFLRTLNRMHEVVGGSIAPYHVSLTLTDVNNTSCTATSSTDVTVRAGVPRVNRPGYGLGGCKPDPFTGNQVIARQ